MTKLSRHYRSMADADVFSRNVQEIGDALGGWTLDRVIAPLDQTRRLLHPTGGQLAFRWSGPGTAEGRLYKVTALLKNDDGQVVMPSRTIGISWMRPKKALARDIARRILTWYWTALEERQAHNVRTHEAKERQADTGAHIAEALGTTPIREWGGKLILTHYPGPLWGEFTIHEGGNISVRLDHVPPTLLAHILEAFQTAERERPTFHQAQEGETACKQ